MARKRARDYDEKRRTILNRSAELFSMHGFDRASMNRIAEACGVSKANLYHYYRDKDALLFDVIRFHLEELLEVVEAADDAALKPHARLRALIAALLEAYRDADSQHNVQISSMRFLSAERQKTLRGIERELVTIFSRGVLGVAPKLKGTTMLMPVTMSLFGMVNWHYLWFRANGVVTRDDYAGLVATLIADGAQSVRGKPAKAKPLISRQKQAPRRQAAE